GWGGRAAAGMRVDHVDTGHMTSDGRFDVYLDLTNDAGRFYGPEELPRELRLFIDRQGNWFDGVLPVRAQTIEQSRQPMAVAVLMVRHDGRSDDRWSDPDRIPDLQRKAARVFLESLGDGHRVMGFTYQRGWVRQLRSWRDDIYSFAGFGLNEFRGE